jgi:hypothetical protein
MVAHEPKSIRLPEWIEGPTKQHWHQQLFGNIVSAVGERRYSVRFDDGSKKECYSAGLREEKTHARFPPDILLPSNEVEH